MVNSTFKSELSALKKGTPGVVSPLQVGRGYYLSFVHSNQALVHFGPRRNGTDVPQLIGVFSERTGLHLQK